MSNITAAHSSFAAWAPAYDSRSWRDEAACRGMTPEESERIFFPEAAGELRKTMYDEARSYCDTCPVIDECLLDAFEMNDRDGFRGGMSAAERLGRRAQIRFVGRCGECGTRFEKPTRLSRFCSKPCLNRQRMRLMRASRSREFI